MTPFRGTGWLGGRTPPGHGPAVYTGAPGTQPYYGASAPPYQQNTTPAPQYGAPPNQGFTGPQGANAGYYAPQSGVELQTPMNSYQPQRGGEPVYAPPPGPPPPQTKEGVPH